MTQSSDGSEQVRDGLCGICPAGCWVRARLRDGKLIGVEPLPDHPLGMICTNGRHSPEIVHDPQRLRRPLRRVGPKGSYDFQPISWDEAYEEIVAKLEATKATRGPEATAIYTGRGSFELSLCDVFQPRDVAISSASSVLFPFGSPNTLGVGALCYVSFAMIAPHVTMGGMYHTMQTDLEQSALILLWGANPATDSPPLAHEQIRRACARGAEVVAIDPRRSESARETGAEWIGVRPGTDGALALSMIEVLIEEELYDEAFVSSWTEGWDALVQYTQHFRPEAVETITGVPAETIRSLARRIAAARGACPVMYSGLEYSDSGVQAIRAVFTLFAIAGQLDVPGALQFRMPASSFPINREGLVGNPDLKRALGRDRHPVYSAYRGESHAVVLPQSVLHGDPYRIRSLIVLGGSLITAWPNPSLWRRTLGALDFLVCIDRHLTADAAYADIVLPATTMYEISSYMTYGPLFKLRERLVEPVGEARDDFNILAELARRLGYGHLYPQTDEERLRHVLEGSGFSLEQVRARGGEVRLAPVMMQYKKWEKGLLRADGAPGFDTPSGKFEIASSVLQEHGYEPLPIYTEPAEGPIARPDLAKLYPLVFNSGARIFADFRSQHHGVPGLSRRAPEPRVTLNDADARARGIEDGSWVILKTPRGQLRYRAQVTADIVAGAIDANMGGGGPLGPKAWQDCNVNELTDLERVDPISGFPVYKALLCEVVADGGGEGLGRPTTEAASEERAQVERVAAPTRSVYLDHNATTTVHPDVLAAMLPYLTEQCGNPSSIHSRGDAAQDALEAARRKVAAALNCTARRIVFTSGGSEADNLALKGVAWSLRDRGKHILTTAFEHPAVLAACDWLESEGFEITRLPVDEGGHVSVDRFAAALRDDTVLASVMMANNEIGTVQPITELAALAHERGALMHTDAVQALGKLQVDVRALRVDLLSLSAHKLYGPKGIGAMYLRRGLSLAPLVHGGQQEGGLRAGTENVPAAVGFGQACELAMRALHARENERIAKLRDRLEEGILALVPGSRVNGCSRGRLGNTTSMTLPAMRGESLVLLLDRHGICFSSGSACKSGDPRPSHVLRAIGLSEEEAHCSIRMSLGLDNDEADVDYVLTSLAEVIRQNATQLRFVACR